MTSFSSYGSLGTSARRQPLFEQLELDLVALKLVAGEGDEIGVGAVVEDGLGLIDGLAQCPVLVRMPTISWSDACSRARTCSRS